LANKLETLSDGKGHFFMDSNIYLKAGEDEVHFNAFSHKRLGEGLFKLIRSKILV